MSQSPDIKNIKANDPNDYTYVSLKNWQRKTNVVNGTDNMANIIGRPGPITGIVLTLVDMVVTLVLKLVFNLFSICTHGFNWIYNLIFGNFNGILPNSITGGSVISLKFFRYTMTLLMPPFGVMLSKGLYGWFNILICMVITYINFIAGVIYAFVITARNRYSDQYETVELTKALNKNEELINVLVDPGAFMGTIGFLLLIGIFLFFSISFF